MFGGIEGSRTLASHLDRVMLYQLSYYSKFGECEGNRTLLIPARQAGVLPEYYAPKIGQGGRI